MSRIQLRAVLVIYLLFMAVVVVLAMLGKLPVQTQRNDAYEAVASARQEVIEARQAVNEAQHAIAAAYEQGYADACEALVATWYMPLNDEELDLAERVVMAEAGNQPFAGQMAVAQCILDRMMTYEQSLTDVVTAPKQFAAPYKGEVTDSVKAAVYAVFHDGTRVADSNLLFFYSTVGGFVSTGHEARNYVMTIDDHKFFN